MSLSGGETQTTRDSKQMDQTNGPCGICPLSHQELKNPVLGKFCEHEMHPLEESSLIEYVKQYFSTNENRREDFAIPCPICKKDLYNKETKNLDYRRAEHWLSLMKERKNSKPSENSIQKNSPNIPVSVLQSSLYGSHMFQNPALHIFQNDSGILTQECIYCRMPIEKSEIETHQVNCAEEVVNCGYREMGCYSRIKRKNMKDHLLEFIEAHLQLSLGTIRQIKNELLYRSPMFFQSHMVPKTTSINNNNNNNNNINNNNINNNNINNNVNTHANNVENWEGNPHPLTTIGPTSIPSSIPFYDHSTGYYWSSTPLYGGTYYPIPPPSVAPTPTISEETSQTASPSHRPTKVRRKKEYSHNKSLSCQMCRVKDTPQWRKGPQGPHTLCNACGLHFNKLAKEKPLNLTILPGTTQQQPATTLQQPTTPIQEPPAPPTTLQQPTTP